jgi:hypothetical protein
MNHSTGWISGGLWIGQLAGVMTLGLVIFMLTWVSSTFVAIDRKRDFPEQEDT